MRYNQPCVCGRSSSGRARPCQGRGSEFEPRRPLQKETPSERMVFLFGIWQRAGLNSLPRPARSALNQEVRQGSREWLCHSWDAGKRVRASSRTPRRSPSCQPPPARCRGAAAGTLPRNRLASSAAGGASALSSSRTPRRSPSCQPPPARCRGAAAGTLPRNRLASSAAGGASALSSSRTPRRSPSCQPPPARYRGAAAGTLPRNRLASSAAGGASALSSSPAPKITTHSGGDFFRVLLGASRQGGQKDQSLSSLRTAMNASVGTCTVPRLRIFFLPSFCFSSSFFLRVMSPP